MTKVKLTKEEKDLKKAEEDWMQKKWRPMMAMMYMTVCFFDFVIFPIMFTVVQFWEVESVNDAFRQWQPLTLSGAGLFHMAMGAVLGITAWSRGQEKMAGVNAPTPPMGGGLPIGNTASVSLPASSTFTPQPMQSRSMVSNSFEAETPTYNEPTFDAPVMANTGPGGKRRVTPAL